MKIDKQKGLILLNLLIVIIYFFRQAVYYINPEHGYFIVGNFDILYIFAIIYIIKNFKKIDKRILLGIGIFILYAILQIIIIKDISVLKIVVNVSKIFLCYFVMLYAKDNIKKLNLNYICKMFSVLCLVFLIISILLPESMLWRHNDTINKYSLERLQFLYTEPGELGMHCVIILLILISNVIKEKKLKNKFILSVYAIPIIISIALTKSLGSIAVGLVAVLVLIIYDWIKNNNKIKNICYIVALALIAIMIALMVFTSNPIYLRIVDTLDGKDSSNNYRIFIPFNVCKQMLLDTYGQGVGFGNAELMHNVEKYEHLKLEDAGIINSFLNFIAEGGILALVVVGVLIYNLIKKSFITNKKVNEKIPLAVFLIIYQFMGTYFTNPLCWILYGLIFSEEDKVIVESEEKDIDGA